MTASSENPTTIIALDLDGTLLRTDKTVSEFTRTTLRALSEAGQRVCFVTGRRERIARDVLKAFDFPSWAIMNNGTLGMTWPARQRLFTHYIPPALVRNVIACLSELDRPPVLLIDPDTSPIDIVMDRRLLSVDIYKDYAKRHEGFVILEDSVAESQRIDRVLGMFLSEPIETIPEFKSHLDSMMGDVIEHRSLDNLDYLPTHRILEIIEPGWMKWNGILELKRCIAGGDARVIAFGDDHNDIDMLAAADSSFATANAIDAAKGAADEIIPSNNDDGVARTLRRLFASL